MADPQIIRSASGEELVVLTRDDYEALIAAATLADEDAEDVAVYDARRADLAAGRDEPLPAAVSAALMKGDRLLRALRKWRALRQTDLAHKSGIAQGYLSDLEAGRRAGTLETLTALATALDIPVSWLTDSGAR